MELVDHNVGFCKCVKSHLLVVLKEQALRFPCGVTTDIMLRVNTLPVYVRHVQKQGAT